MSSGNYDHPRRWAQFRFSVIGGLLSSPPGEGELKNRIASLAGTSWIHPITGEPFEVKFSTIERWFYAARKAHNPVDELSRRQRHDRGSHPSLSPTLKEALRQQYSRFPSWNYRLHADNARVVFVDDCPSYDSIRRFMKRSGLVPQKRHRSAHRDGFLQARKHFEQRERRGYEVAWVGGLLHLDFHSCSRPVLTAKGEWITPKMCAILDDHSRLACHVQWCLSETAEDLVHCYVQAILKRGLPRATMSDNGSAMTSEEFTGGLQKLSITHKLTLPYSPWQNGKQGAPGKAWERRMRNVG